MEGMTMETEGTLYQTIHCKECGLLVFVKSGSLNRYCYTCRKKRVLQIKEVFSIRHKVNLLKGVLAKN